MPRPHSLAFLGLLATTWVAAGASCRAPSAQVTEDEHAAAMQAAIEAGVEARLRELFPEVRGTPTREAIQAALQATVVVAQGDEQQLIAWVRSGAWDEASQFLARRLASAEGARARELMAAGDVRGALALYDQAVERMPRDTELRLERAEAAWVLARADNDLGLYEATLAEFETVLMAGLSTRAALGAARCARAVGKTERGVAHARGALNEALRAGNDTSPALLHSCRVVAADLLLLQQSEAEAVGEGTRALECAEEGLGLLRAALEAKPDDSWAWRALASRLLVMRRTDQATQAARDGLARLGPDAGLLGVLVSGARELGGRELLVRELQQLQQAQPEWAYVPYELGRAAYESGLEQLDLAQDRASARAEAQAAFVAAEAYFRAATRASELEPSCNSYRAVARSGMGWLALQAGDLNAARERFLSTQDFGRAALRLEALPLIPSAVAGLHSCGARFAALAQDPLAPEALDALESAARIYAFLFETEPDVVDWANNAGFFQRDLAVALEIRARELASTPEVGRQEREAANRLLTRAVETMEASLRAYRAAAALAPDDVRIVNDTGLILTYYLQRDAVLAKEYLQRAVVAGEAQVRSWEAAVAELDIADDERALRRKRLEEVATALGDAYQNLGVLALTLEGDARTAQAWLERSLTTGVDPREEVRGKGGYLERCTAVLASGADPRVRPDQRWAAPIAVPSAQTGVSKKKT